MKRLAAVFYRDGKLFLRFLLIAVLLEIVFAAGCVFAANALSERNSRYYEPVRVAIVNKDTSDEAALMVSLMTKAVPSLRNIVSFSEMDEDEAARLIAEGGLSGALIIPQDAVAGYIYGRGMPEITVLVADNTPYEALILEQLTKSGESMLKTGQAGSFAVQHIMAEQGDSEHYDEVASKINLVLVSKSLNAYADMTVWESIPVAGALLPLREHHLLCFMVFFLLVSSVLWIDYLFSDTEPQLLRRLLSCGLSAFGLALIKIAYVLAFNAASTLLLIGITGRYIRTDVAAAASGAVVFAAFVTTFAAAVCGITGEKRSSIFTIFAVSSAGLVLGGGVVPVSLLPKALGTLGGLMPNRLGYLLLAPAYGTDTNGAAVLTALLLTAAMLVLCGFMLKRRAETQGGDSF